MHSPTTVRIQAAACALLLATCVSKGAEIARWELDETSGATAVDSVGAFDGAISAGAILDRPGKLGTAFEFNGADDSKVVVSGGVGLAGNAARTICGWGRATTTNQSSWSTLFGFSYTGSTGSTFFDVEIDGSTPKQFVVHCYSWERPFMTVDTSWHFFAASYDGLNTIKMYLDGALIATHSGAPTLDIQDHVQIGWRRSGGGFRGLVDDVRIYDSVLTDGEITTLFQQVPPSAQRVTADDANNADDLYSAGDSVTFSFDTDMNGSTTVTGNLSGSDMDTYFDLSGGHTWGSAGTVATGEWADARTLVLTIVDETGGNPTVGDVVSISTTAGIGNSSGTHTNVAFTCPGLDGDWGVPPNDALLVHYKLDETSGTELVDDRGGYDATLVGVDLDYDAIAGQVDGAINFVGPLTYARHVQPAGLQGLAEYTVMAWVRPDQLFASSLGTPIVNLAEYNSDAYLKINNGFALVLYIDGDSKYRFGVNTHDIVIDLATTTEVQLGTWYHVAASYNSGTGQYRVWVNGAVEGNGGTTYAPPAAADLEICLAALEGSSLKCGLDEVRIYGTPLSDAYVAAVYQDLQLTLATTDATADEDPAAADTGLFTITRTGRDVASSPAITVTLSLAGTADDPAQSPPDYDVTVTNGSGLTYTGSGNLWEVTMDAGATTMTLTIVPEDDLGAYAEGDESVVATLAPSDQYLVGTQNTGTVTITDDDVPLTFDLESPLDDTTEVSVAGGVNFQWQRPAGTLADSYTLTLSVNWSMYPPLATVPVIDPGTGTTVTHNLAVDTDKHIYWTVVAHDVAGDTDAATMPFDFYTTDTIAPSVLNLTPDDPDADDSVSVVFDEYMNFPAGLGALFTFKDPAGTDVPGTWTGTAGTAAATFTPAADLEFETTYTITAAASLADMVGHTLAGGLYTGTVTTRSQLGGFGIGEGCASGARGASLTVALCAIAAFLVLRTRRGSRLAAGRVCLVAALALTLGCSAVPAAFESPAPAPAILTHAPAVASLSQYDYGASSEYYATPSKKKGGGAELKIAPRGGLVMFLGTEIEVPPRLTFGAFARLLESDASRIEVGLDLTPSLDGDDRTNVYATVTGDYVGFIGDTGLYWKAGGGFVMERQDDAGYFLGIMEGGAGFWLPVGEDNAAVVNAMLQIPLGEANPAALLVITGAYEF